MSLPNKLYINKFMIRPGMLHPAEFPPDNPEEEYIRVGALRQWMNDYLKIIEFTANSKEHIIGSMEAYQNIINRLEKL